EPHRVLVVAAVPARRPRRLGQQAAALVVTQRLDVDAGPPRRLRSPHARTLNPYLGTEINPQSPAAGQSRALVVTALAGSRAFPLGACPRLGGCRPLPGPRVSGRSRRRGAPSPPADWCRGT